MHNIKSTEFSQVNNSHTSFPKMTELFKMFKIQAFIDDVFKKSKGITIFEIFCILFTILFKESNSIYSGLCCLGEKSKKTTINSFLNNPFYNWRKLTLYVAKTYIRLFKPDAGRPSALIIDDSPRAKTGSICEHISTFKKTSDLTDYNGYEFVLLAWTNLRACIPIDFVLKTGKRIASSLMCIYPEHSHINQRHRESRLTKLEICINMIKRAIKHGIVFKYVLWDSAYNSDACYRYVYNNLVPKQIHLVTRLANTNEKYLYRGKRLNITQIYETVTKWDTAKFGNRVRECQSVVVKIEEKYRKDNLRKRKKRRKNKRGTHIVNDKYRKTYGEARIYFFRKPGVTHKFYAILSTNTELSIQEAEKLYSIRWSIEVLFRDFKQYFGFDQSHSQKYAPQIADLSIKCAFYTMMCVFRERAPNKSRRQILLEFAYEFENYCMQLYHEMMLMTTLVKFFDFVDEYGIKTFKQLKENANRIIEVFWRRENEKAYNLIL